MTVDNWITVMSAIIIAAGWFVTGYLNRLQSISQKRLEYRLETLKSFLPVWFTIQQNGAPFLEPGFLGKLETTRANFQLYGYQDEINCIESFISAVERRQLENANTALAQLVPLVQERIRKELKLNA